MQVEITMNAAKLFLKLSLQSGALYKQCESKSQSIILSLFDQQIKLLFHFIYYEPMLPKWQTLMNRRLLTGRDMVLCETKMLLIWVTVTLALSFGQQRIRYLVSGCGMALLKQFKILRMSSSLLTSFIQLEYNREQPLCPQRGQKTQSHWQVSDS